MEIHVEDPPKLNIELLCDLTILLLGIYPKESKSAHRYLHTHVYCSTVHGSQDNGILMSVHQLMKGWRKCGIHTQWSTISHKEEWDVVICRKVNITRHHHVEGDKLSSERHVSHFVSYLESTPKIIVSILIIGINSWIQKWDCLIMGTSREWKRRDDWG
jgi:hypothetical protein